LRKNKRVSCLMVFAMMIAITFSAVIPVNAAVTLNDIGGHWAQSQIESLVGQGVVNGYPDGSFKPENTITRAEFMTMANKAFKFTESATIDYKDVQPSDWFAGEVARAKAAGYIAGYQDGTMQPNKQISRQEVAIIVAKILKLDTLAANEALQQFKDASSIPSWSKAYLAAAVKAALIKGYPDGTVKAENSIKRAEAVVILSQALKPLGIEPAPPVAKTTYDKAGTYGPASGSETIDKNVSIAADGIVLQNMLIKGDLLISEAVGAGKVTLKNVSVTGTTTIKGGGENSIYLDGCKLAVVKAEKADGKLRIVLSGDTSISEFVANSGVKVVGKGIITKASINKSGVNIEPTPGQTTLASGISAIVGGKTVYGPASSGGGGGGGGPSGPTVVDNLAAGTHAGNYKITSSGTKGPASGLAEVTGTLYLDPGATGSISLQNVKANKIEVSSGAPNTIIFINVQVTVTLTVNTGTQAQTVRIVTQGTTSINQTIASSAVTLQQDEGSLGNIQINTTVNVTLDGDFSSQTVTVSSSASGAGVNVTSGSTVNNVIVNTSVNLSGDGTLSNVQVVQANTTVSLSINTDNIDVSSTAAGSSLQVEEGTQIVTIDVEAEIRIDNDGTIITVVTTVTVSISGNTPNNTQGSGKVVKAPRFNNVTIGGISPIISSSTSGYTLTFSIDPNAMYTSGTATLSEDVSFIVQNANYSFDGTASTSDNLLDMALIIFALKGGKDGDVCGSTLIANSPLIFTLTGAEATTVYSIVFQ